MSLIKIERPKQINSFKFGYIIDLISKKKYPLIGLKRDRDSKFRKIISILMFEREWKKVDLINYQQPFRIYWNFNALRRAMNKSGNYKYGPQKMLPEHLAIVEGYIFMCGSASGRVLRDGGTTIYSVAADPLNKFEVFKQVNIAKKRKKFLKVA